MGTRSRRQCWGEAPDARRWLVGLAFAAALRCASGMVLVLSVWIAPIASARAQDVAAARVLFVFRKADDPLLLRIETEVAAVGFTVIEHTGAEPLDALARMENAAAAVRALPSGAGVEVWMADATSGRSLLRQVIVDESPGGPDHALIALQTSELLRTSLLSPPHTKPSSGSGVEGTQPGPDVEEPPAIERGAVVRRVVHLGPGALYTAGGAGPAFQLWLSLQQSMNEHLKVALDVSLPLIAPELANELGRAEVGMYSGTFTLLAHVAPRGPWFAAGGVGLGIAHLRFEGHAEAPLQSASPGLWTCTGSLRAEAGADPVRWLRLGASALVGATCDRVRVQFADSPSGEWGRGFLGAYAFVGVPLR